MKFRPTDHASEKPLKLDVIAVYNHRLDETEKWKKSVIERNLLDYKKPPVGGKNRGRVSEGEREGRKTDGYGWISFGYPA